MCSLRVAAEWDKYYRKDGKMWPGCAEEVGMVLLDWEVSSELSFKGL